MEEAALCVSPPSSSHREDLVSSRYALDRVKFTSVRKFSIVFAGRS